VIVYVNGAYLPAAQARVSIFDGGYMYGDGIYTTLRLYHGLPLDLAAHHARLVRQTAQMQIGFGLTLVQLRNIIGELVKRNDLTAADGRLRITISRAGDPVDPLPLHNLNRCPTTITMTLVAVSPALTRWQDEGIAVICLDHTFARGNFPDLKTLNALATLTALRRAAAADCPEALLTGADGRLLEGAVSNIFLVIGTNLITPASEGEFLAGRTRERILKIANREQITVREEIVSQQQLATAAEVFVVSSVREVLPVVTIDGRSVGNSAPGPVTRLVQRRYRSLIARDLATQQDAKNPTGRSGPVG